MPVAGRDIVFALRARDMATRDIRSVAGALGYLSSHTRDLRKAQKAYNDVGDRFARQLGYQGEASLSTGEAYRRLNQDITDTANEGLYQARRRLDEIIGPEEAHIRQLRSHNQQLEAGRDMYPAYNEQIRKNNQQIAQSTARVEEAKRAYQNQTREINRGAQVQKRRAQQMHRQAQDELAVTEQRVAKQRQLGQRYLATGAILTTLGVGLGFVGFQGIKAFSGMTLASSEFRKGMALAATQATKAGVSVSELIEITGNVAGEIGAPLEEMDEALYDIFSTVEVTGKEAQFILREVSKTAVAGQVELRDAMRPTLGIMNAWNMTAEDTVDILDMQFAMVERGVGTYEEFATVIGKAIPPAKVAGQTFEEVAGAMTFLTRETSMSAAQAATSTARAIELLTDPKAIKGIEAMGVQVKNARGEFRPFSDIVGDIADEMQGLTKPEVISRMKELFGGAGYRIQARRFLQAAITDVKGYRREIEMLGERSGAAARAFALMSEEPAVQAQLLKNNWELLRNEIGQFLIPSFNLVIGALIDLLQLFRSLPDPVKRNIVVFLSIASAVLAVVGVVTTLVGVFFLLKGAAMIVGVSLLGAIGVVSAAIIGLIGVALWLKANWKDVGEWWIATWERMKEPTENLKNHMLSTWATLRGQLVALWETIRARAAQTWERIRGPIMGFVNWARDTLISLIVWFRTDFIGWFQETAAPALAKVWDQIRATVASGFDALASVFEVAINMIRIVWENFGRHIWRVVVEGALSRLWPWFKDTFSNIVDFLGGVFRVMQGIFQVIAGVLTGDWEKLWEGVKNIFGGTWDAIVAIFKTAFSTVMNVSLGIVSGILAVFGVSLEEFIDWWGGVWDTTVDIFSAAWDWIVNAARTMADWFSRAWDAIAEAVSWAWNTVILPILKVIGIIIAGTIVAAVWLAAVAFKGAWALISSIVKGVWQNVIRPIIGLMIWLFRNALVPTLEFLGKVFGAIWDGIAAATTWLWGVFKSAWRGIANIAKWAWKNVLSPIGRELVDFYNEALVPSFRWLRDVFVSAWRLIARIAKWAWNNVLKPVWNALWAFGQNRLIPAFKAVGRWFKSVWDGIVRVAKWAWNNAIRPVWDAIRRFVDRNLIPIFRKIRSVWNSVWASMRKKVRDIWEGIKSIVKRSVDRVGNFISRMIDSLIRGINNFIGILNKIPFVKIPLLQERRRGGVGTGVDAYHTGGEVRGGQGAIGDNVPAVLQTGEYVINRRAAQQLGPDVLERLNSGTDVFGLREGIGQSLNPFRFGSHVRGPDPMDFVQKFYRGGARFLASTAKRIMGPLLNRLPDDRIGIGETLRGIANRTVDALIDHVPEAPPLGPGVGWRAMWQAVSSTFPQARLHSAFRPGAITATGNRSYHAMGRAIDISPIMEIAEWLRATYKPMLKELIYSPLGARQVWNGMDHYYTGITRDMHWDHIHAAMEAGGIVRKSGMFMVGEQGPELAYMQSGTRVATGGDDIVRLLGSIDEKVGSGVTIESGAVQITIDGSADPQRTAREIEGRLEDKLKTLVQDLIARGG